MEKTNEHVEPVEVFSEHGGGVAGKGLVFDADITRVTRSLPLKQSSPRGGNPGMVDPMMVDPRAMEGTEPTLKEEDGL